MFVQRPIVDGHYEVGPKAEVALCWRGESRGLNSRVEVRAWIRMC